MSKSCMDLMMFSSCSHDVREADWREREREKLKKLIRDTERGIHSEMGTFRDRGSKEGDTQRDLK